MVKLLKYGGDWNGRRAPTERRMDSIPEIRRRNRKRVRLVRIGVSILILALVTAAVLYLLGWGDMASSKLHQFYRRVLSGMESVSFRFVNGGEAFADFGGGVAAAGSGGLQVYNRKAELVFTEVFDMKNPAVVTRGGYGVAYDAGGTAARFFDRGGVTARITTAKKILSAAVSGSGHVALTTQYDGYKGLVTVYDSAGNELYKWFSATAYALSAALSPDGREMAALTLGGGGSRVAFFPLDSDKERAACFLEDVILLEISHLGADGVLAVGTGELVRILPDGQAAVLLDFSDRYLETYTLWDEGVFLSLNTYAVGSQGYIAVIDREGTYLGVREKGEKILSVSGNGDKVAVLYPERLVIYNKQLEILAEYDVPASARHVLMRGDGTALVLSKYAAEAYSASAPAAVERSVGTVEPGD